MSHPMLNLANLKIRSQVNGPGIRSVVWVQGCSIGCPGCFNPHTHTHSPNHLCDPRELGEMLLQATDVDGITVSGGEPFEQAEACAILLETYRAGGRSAMVFSGYTYAGLRRSRHRAVRRLLTATDVLVAGPFVQRLCEGATGWRGSRNQTVHFLTGRIKPDRDSESSVRPVVEVTLHGQLATVTGFPEEKDLVWLARLGGNVPSVPSTSRE